MNTYRWRTIDIVIASVIAVAFGVIFWAWNLLWGATSGAFSFFAPAQTVIYGVWLIPAVLAGLIIRKPGASLYTETLAALISALLGAQWRAPVTLQGFAHAPVPTSRATRVTSEAKAPSWRSRPSATSTTRCRRRCWPACSPG